MGREIRRVPPGWQHPRDERGNYRPMYDQTFDEAMDGWNERRKEWNMPGNKQRAKYEAKVGRPVPFEEWDGPPPDPAYFRPAFPEGSATAFQIYQTVSEGSPVSPVFATREALIDYLVNDGSGMGIGGDPQRLTREAAERFVGSGYAPSAIGIDGAGLFPGVVIHERKR